MTAISPEALKAAKERLRKAQKQAADAIRFFATWEVEIDLEAKGLLEKQYEGDNHTLSRHGTRRMRMLAGQIETGDCLANGVVVAVAREVLEILEPGVVEKCLERKAKAERAAKRRDTEWTIYRALWGHTQEFGPDSAMEMLNFALESLETLGDIPAGTRAVLVPTNVVPLNRHRA